MTTDLSVTRRHGLYRVTGHTREGRAWVEARADINGKGSDGALLFDGFFADLANHIAYNALPALSVEWDGTIYQGDSGRIELDSFG